MKNFIFILLLSAVCAFPLNEYEENGQEYLPSGANVVNEESDDQLVTNKSLIDNQVVHPDDKTPSVQSDNIAPLAQPALDLNRDLQTNFKVENWNGGTVNTGLTIETAYFISDVHCSGVSCTVRVT